MLFVRQLIIFIFSLAVITSCSSPHIDLGAFDKQLWQSDKYGCNNARSAMSAHLIKVTDQLAEQPESLVREILGNPDREELDARMKKTLYYFLEPGPKCGDQHKKGPIRTLTIELDPVGRKVKLVTFQLIR